MRGFRIELLAGVAAIAIGLLLPFAANAAGDDDTRDKMMSKIDTNHDGVISDDEWNAARDARFKKLDANGDGFLSSDEMTAGAKQHNAARSEKMFKRMDTDGDGKISKAEYDAASAKMRERMKTRMQGNGAAKPDAPAEKAE